MWTERLIVCAALTLAGWAQAETPANISSGEVALLPDYCADTQTFSKLGTPDSPTVRQRKWVGIMGRSFWALHHYCWALVSERRSQAAGMSHATRDHLLNSAVADSYYVIREGAPDFVLLPEIYTRIGEFFVKLGQPGEAQAHFDKAREIKPDYWPPYARSAELLSRLDRKQSALKVLETGLEQMPDEPKLIEFYRRLGGQRTSFAVERPASAAQ
jgi:tetratricopeptide (TPR) repeat protein